jgi:hypothetical protein
VLRDAGDDLARDAAHLDLKFQSLSAPSTFSRLHFGDAEFDLGEVGNVQKIVRWAVGRCGLGRRFHGLVSFGRFDAGKIGVPAVT